LADLISCHRTAKRPDDSRDVTAASTAKLIADHTADDCTHHRAHYATGAQRVGRGKRLNRRNDAILETIA
jgi:hypothetical protein